MIAPTSVTRGRGSLAWGAAVILVVLLGSRMPSSAAPCRAEFRGLGTLPGHVASAAFGLSGDGKVVVGTSFGDENSPQAFRWTARDGLVGLGVRPMGFGGRNRREPSIAAFAPAPTTSAGECRPTGP
jgi:probable HAF family extracellular repeat protein